MPSLRPDSIFQEWIFSEEEALQAKILNELQIKYLNTMYCQLTKEKAANLIPESSMDDRSFLLKVAELDGKMAMITQLFTDHKEAIRFMAVRNVNNGANPVVSPLSDITDLEQRASQLVNHQN